MSNIQETLDSLQPYVIGIRYLEGTVLVDAVFKEGWTIPTDTSLNIVKGEEGMNYYMIFSSVKGVGLDDLLNYVGKVIKINLEREKKHELLRTKVNELKEVFKVNSFDKLLTLKFVFGEEDLVPKFDDFDLDDDIGDNIAIETTNMETPINVDMEKDIITDTPTQHVSFLDENGVAIELTDEDKEMLEEEARAERNRKILEAKKDKVTPSKIKPKVELPPKRKLEMAMTDNFGKYCDCGDNEACPNCIDTKY
jgi:hypothetical protein